MPVNLKIGQTIEGKPYRYEILEQISKGNFNAAFRARNLTTGKDVFLKYYYSPTPTVPWYSAYIEYVRRINELLENSSAAQYCVLCQDLFEANPRPGYNKVDFLFQTFEFIDSSKDLDHMLHQKDTPLAWEKRVSMAKVFLSAMRHIHQVGIVHGDLKPENVQMVENPKSTLGYIPRMIDMDRSIIAKQKAPWADGGINSVGYVGSPGYFSPEHLQGLVPQLASDVFTIGIILSQILAAQHPFQNYTSESDLYKKAVLEGGQFTPIKLKGDLGGKAENSRQYERLIETCFDIDPRKRPTCEALHLELLALDKGVAPMPMPTAMPTPTRTPTAMPRKVSDVKARHLLIQGDIGMLPLKLSMKLGIRSLKNISSQAEYAASEQFDLRYDASSMEWTICVPTCETKNHTALNHKELTEDAVLKDGDVIGLISKKSSNTAMDMTISFKQI